MPVYRYDTAAKQMVKISDRSYRSRTGTLMERPFCEQIREGYRKVEAKGQRINGTPTGIKRIWGF